jgi:hypothetical protein
MMRTIERRAFASPGPSAVFLLFGGKPKQQKNCLWMSSLGSLTDIAAALPNVRFTPADSTGQRNTF